MKKQARFLFGIAVVIAWLAATVVPGIAEGLSKEQGDAILTELRQIRALLEKPQRSPAPTPQGPPPQEKVSLKLGDEYALGSANAPVTIVEYTDYQCPFCSRFHVGAYAEIRKNFIDTGKVRFIKRDLALDFHPKALKAAQAARCAGDQGKFWEMHDLLSANPETLGPESYAKFAGDIALDAGKFRSCVESDRHIAGIRESGKGAAAIGINGTPSFVVGTVMGDTLVGARIVGAQPYSVFEKAIREYLAAKTGEKPAN